MILAVYVDYVVYVFEIENPSIALCSRQNSKKRENVILSADQQRWAGEISPNGRYAIVWLCVYDMGDSSKAGQVGLSQNDE